MANFPVDPLPYISRGGALSDGGGALRRRRGTVSLSGQIIKRNEDVAIATAGAHLSSQEQQELIPLIYDHITQVLHFHVQRYSIYPLGVGIFKMGSIFQRDCLVASAPHWIGGRMINFVNHDEAPNHRNSPAARIGWIMFLAYPLDFKEFSFLEQVVASFGKLLYWHSEDPSMARVMIKVLYDNPIDVPRSITLKSCHSMDGAGRSWTFPVFLLQNEFADRFPLDEDDLPPNGGNPHPFNGEVLPGEPEWVQHWADEQLLQGAFPVDLAPEENPHLIHVMDPPAAADDAWEAWPVQPPQVQVIEQPQDAVSAQMSGVSNQHTSDSFGTVQAAQSSPASPERLFPKPLVTAVFKRRARQSAPTAQTLSADHTTAGTASLALPVNPTVEDFAQASVAGMAHAPLTIDQIQHCATHYCGLLAAQVTSDELLRDPAVDSQIVPVAAIPTVDNVDT
ncbi:hypothetical protein GUJ93_ZPchr0012g19630 [Zizania palustris]|uniref:DUF7597 domain-containing protein n=1 Tax=Zizania palustris TaxID=103762 RepID=A0A8J5WR31_ZIZPA|nr:hypothetical protein GUJ93_ZPchr0012g19630 [Zizania palustris]